MKNNLFLIILIFNLSVQIFGQDLDGYKYIFIPHVTTTNQEDTWGISTKLNSLFINKGFIVLTEGSIIPPELKNNPCLLLKCSYNYDNPPSLTQVTLILENCHKNRIYYNTGEPKGQSPSLAIPTATETAFNKIKKMKYSFNASYSEILLDSIKNEDDSISTLDNYFDFSFNKKINGYRYILVSDPIYQYDQKDIFRISWNVREQLMKKGFIVLSNDNKLWPIEAKGNPCLILYVSPINSGGFSLLNPYKVNIPFKNCLNEQILTISKDAFNGYRTPEENINVALKKCLIEIDKMNYTFDSRMTPEIILPDVESTLQTEETIKTYLLSNKLDPLEGIYKSYQSENIGYYKIGIIKQDELYKAIIIESDLNEWKPGEVKAVFEQSSMKSFYSVKWYQSNKTPTETFGMLENGALLSIEFDSSNGEKRQSKFIKMFPVVNSESSIEKDNAKAAGSGFFITSNGIIATNAHVVEGASKIEITISNEIGNFTYNAKVLLLDNKNDVALLQVDDKNFKGYTTIPFGIAENADVGSKVFTIGFPLNDIMGSNYKVTDGIISSKSGLSDDVRYYQISVPLQPGNSGGPLFNKVGNVIGITSSKLNSVAVGTQIENVNYAIKSSYLLNLYNMLPNTSKISTVSQVSIKELQDQVKVLKNYVCLIKVY